MLSTLATSLAGMAAAVQQIAVSAGNIASAGIVPGAALSAEPTTGADRAPTVEVRPVRTNSTPASGAADTAASSDADPVRDLLRMLEAQQSFVANAHTTRTVADVFQSLYGDLED